MIRRQARLPSASTDESDERYLRAWRGNGPRSSAELARRLSDRIVTSTALEAVGRRADGLPPADPAAAGGAYPCGGRAPHVVLALPFTLLRDVRLDLELPPVQAQRPSRIGVRQPTPADGSALADTCLGASGHRSGDGERGGTTDLPFQSHVGGRAGPMAGAAGILTQLHGRRPRAWSWAGGSAADPAAERWMRGLEDGLPRGWAPRARHEGGPLPLAVAPLDAAGSSLRLRAWSGQVGPGIAGADGRERWVRCACWKRALLPGPAQGFMGAVCETGEAAAEANPVRTWV
jgi:monoamine oxidase